MNPARTNSGCVTFDEQHLWPDRFEKSGALPVSPIDVVEYLVQNEPLTHVAEISRRVDEYASQLEQDSFAAVNPLPPPKFIPPFEPTLNRSR